MRVAVDDRTRWTRVAGRCAEPLVALSPLTLSRSPGGVWLSCPPVAEKEAEMGLDGSYRAARPGSERCSVHRHLGCLMARMPALRAWDTQTQATASELPTVFCLLFQTVCGAPGWFGW